MTTPALKKDRLPTRKRAAEEALPPFVLTKRDGTMIQSVATYRALTSLQLYTLLGEARTEKQRAVPNRFLNRLKLLYHAGYLERVEQPQLLSDGRKPLLYFLDSKGAHLIRTNDIRIAITVSAQKNSYTVEEWIDDTTLKSAQMKDVVVVKTEAGNTAKTAIVPDGYFRLIVPTAEGKQRVFHSFLECDLGTMTAKASVWGRRDFRHKILAYTAYYNSGKYEARYGAKTMRVVTVTTSEERLKTLKAVTEEAGGKSRFWFTTFARLQNKDILSAYLWEVASKEGVYALTEPPAPQPSGETL